MEGASGTGLSKQVPLINLCQVAKRLMDVVDLKTNKGSIGSSVEEGDGFAKVHACETVLHHHDDI